jgi:hypothetical protein
MEGYRDEAPFDASMMVHFRKRITPRMLAEINERIQEEQIKKNEKRKRRLKRKGRLR